MKSSFCSLLWKSRQNILQKIMLLAANTGQFYRLFKTCTHKEERGETKKLLFLLNNQIASVERSDLHSQVSACVGSETVYLHVLEWVFDALALSLCASVADNDVCVGLSACFSSPMWATRIFNLCTKPLQSLLSHLSFSFSSAAQFKPIPSQGYPCTPEVETAHTTKRYLRAIVL